jgi:hypothetical protein
LTSALDGGEWSALLPGRFTPKERAPSTHWNGGWVGLRAGLDMVLKSKIPSPRQESNPDHSVFQPVASKLDMRDYSVTERERVCPTVTFESIDMFTLNPFKNSMSLSFLGPILKSLLPTIKTAPPYIWKQVTRKRFGSMLYETKEVRRKIHNEEVLDVCFFFLLL